MTLLQQNSLEQWASWLSGVVSQVLKPYEHTPAALPKAAKVFLLNWSFYRWAQRQAHPKMTGWFQIKRHLCSSSSSSSVPWWFGTWLCAAPPALALSTSSGYCTMSTCTTWWSTGWPRPKRWRLSPSWEKYVSSVRPAIFFFFLLHSSPSKLLDGCVYKSSLCCSLPVASRAGSLQTWRKVSLPRNAAESSPRWISLTQTFMSVIVRRRGGGRRGERRWDQRLGAAVQLSSRCGQREGSDGSACQAAPDESEPAVRASVWMTGTLSSLVPFNLSSVPPTHPVYIYMFCVRNGEKLFTSCVFCTFVMRLCLHAPLLYSVCLPFLYCCMSVYTIYKQYLYLYCIYIYSIYSPAPP